MGNGNGCIRQSRGQQIFGQPRFPFIQFSKSNVLTDVSIQTNNNYPIAADVAANAATAIKYV